MPVSERTRSSKLSLSTVSKMAQLPVVCTLMEPPAVSSTLTSLMGSWLPALCSAISTLMAAWSR